MAELAADTGLPHGKKRPAEGDPEDQPLAKKFGRLQLGTSTLPSMGFSRYTDYYLDIISCKSDPIANYASPPDSSDRSTTSSDSSLMMLDDTKHTIYIHDLDREIEDIDKTDSAFSFLPGLGENLSTIPRLLVPAPGPKGNELVLYREPASLTVPREADNVRRALIETRERARRGNRVESCSPGVGVTPGPSEDAVDLNHSGQDDQMDIDTGV